MKSFGVKKKILNRGDNEAFHLQVIIVDEMSKIDKLNKDLGVMESSIVVSIQCLVYNHKPFLRDCLEGFVMQKTNFKFEAIVHDDASTDGSADIIREYAEKYPDIIQPIYRTENLYQKDKVQFREMIIKHYVGKYVAICEGDDYWTDPYKLQKQVDFLEANPDYTMCFHNAEILNTEGIDHFPEKEVEDRDYISDDFLETNLLETNPPTASFVVRREVLDYELVGRERCFYGDLALNLSAAELGKTRGFSDVMSVYRVHGTSAMHSESSAYLLIMRAPVYYEFLRDNFRSLSRSKINNKIGRYYLRRYPYQKKFSKAWFYDLIKGSFLAPHIARKIILEKILGREIK